MELNLKGKHIFSVIRLVSKLKLKEDCIKLFKEYGAIETRYNNISTKLKIALGDKENNEENMGNLLLKNEQLKNELANVQEDKKELMLDIVFLIIDKIANGEKEVISLLADLYGVKMKDIEGLSPSELIKAIKDVVTNEEIQKAFSYISK